MTLIQTVMTADLVIQVADRRPSRPDGSLFDDNHTKLVCWNTSFAVGFAGLPASIVPSRSRCRSGSPRHYGDYASFENRVDALRYWSSGRISQLPTGKDWRDKPSTT
jgi:hypothetical protein